MTLESPGSYNPDNHYEITITWSDEDVFSVRPDLNQEQARQVLDAVLKNHDAQIGINWDVLTVTASELFPEPGNLETLKEKLEDEGHEVVW